LCIEQILLLLPLPLLLRLITERAQEQKSNTSSNDPQTKTQERGNKNKSHQQTNSVNNARVVKLVAKRGKQREEGEEGGTVNLNAEVMSRNE
jgi:hypothetical protein